MPLIVFGRDHKAHLAFLSTVEEEGKRATHPTPLTKMYLEHFHHHFSSFLIGMLYCRTFVIDSYTLLPLCTPVRRQTC